MLTNKIHNKISVKMVKALNLYLSIALLLLFTNTVYAQANTGLKSSLPDSVIERKLVELALRGPEMQSAQHRSRVYEYQLKSARNSWVNLLTFNVNYNEQSFQQQNNPYQIPRYGVGLTVPLGTILSRTQVKAANEAVAIGVLDEEQLKRKISADVISLYKQYKLQGELIAMETGMMNDVEAALSEARDKFRRNDISFEAYNIVQRNRNDEYAKILNLKLQQDMIKLDIERMIGTSLESVMR